MSLPRPAAVVVLAAGAGTRMRSATPKVLHRIGGRSLLGHVMAAARGLEPERLAVVVRHERDLVAAHVTEVDPGAVVVDQDDIPGTGRAVQCALAALDAQGELDGPLVVVAGDTPLLDADTLGELLRRHAEERNAVTVLTAELDEPYGYGRILRDANGSVTGVVEEKDATEDQRAIHEVNTSTYVFDAAVLRAAIAEVDQDNAQGEVYLTDVVAGSHSRGLPVHASTVPDAKLVEGCNDRVQLAQLGAELNRRTLERHMRAGVGIVDPSTTWIDVTVDIAPDVTILPGCQLYGATTIATDAVVGPEVTLTDTEVGEGAHVLRTHANLAVIGAGAEVGPFTHLRPGTRIGARGKVGSFAETKNATLGDGAKVPHLAYVGDGDVGENANIGCGTVFANYDGSTKHRTVVGREARIGSGTRLVAPVTVGDGAYTGAGAVIREDVPPGALAVSAPPQRTIDGWVARRRPGTPAAEAAQNAIRDGQQRENEENR